ncbi:MAG: hypothetical protein GXX90_04885 [Microbacteriaceae bacterium]|nr:hypothetical protein [Microbacteriaceae bacterium]
MPRSAPPLTGGDALRLGALAGFAAVLLAPLRHYVGPMKRVTEAKIEHDSFPLSTYPMFSADRRGRIVIPHVVGFTADGERVIPHYRHYGSGGHNQVRKQLARDVRQGRAVEVAQRYADSLAAADRERRGGEAAILRVAVVRARYVFDDWFAGDRAPQAESVHAECAVGGTATAGPGEPLPRLRTPGPQR